MRPKARGLTQNGGLPGWLEESDPAGVILYVMDVPYRLPFRTVPVVLIGAAQLRADGISRCCYIVTIRLELCHARKAWTGTLVDPSLLSG
jgi:hypothetical protein